MSETSEKRVFIRTYGCQMNVYDSERMAESLSKAGYTTTQSADEADLVVLNTCHIREKAAEKVYSEVGRMRMLREQSGRDVKIAVTGCVAQAEGAEQRRDSIKDVGRDAGLSFRKRHSGIHLHGRKPGGRRRCRPGLLGPEDR